MSTSFSSCGKVGVHNKQIIIFLASLYCTLYLLSGVRGLTCKKDRTWYMSRRWDGREARMVQTRIIHPEDSLFRIYHFDLTINAALRRWCFYDCFIESIITLRSLQGRSLLPMGSLVNGTWSWRTPGWEKSISKANQEHQNVEISNKCFKAQARVILVQQRLVMKESARSCQWWDIMLMTKLVGVQEITSDVRRHICTDTESFKL